MRRFLVVGCGGSGGKVLAHLMDRLRADLAAHGVHRLPAGWRFVHIDVPSTSESGPPGVGSVQEQGGTYFGVGSPRASYRVVDTAVSRRLANGRRLDCIATWAPRDTDKVINPIADGASQYRAIGRMITLSRATEIRNVLQQVWGELGAHQTTEEMRGLAVPGLGAYEPAVPIVLVVSSMAGGAGASLALDVTRLLALVNGVDPRLVGMFLLAPNIFDTLPQAGRTGVGPNALAMLGELVAGQAGNGEADVATLTALGLHPGHVSEPTFARVFPVGRFAGVDRTALGDGQPDTVYRTLGRGLAALIMSHAVTDQFVAYDLGNTASPSGDRDLLGWGATWEPLPWGSFGHARLSMGRDRYAEYAAQRLASACVARLLDSHRRPGYPAPGPEQVAAQWPEICSRIRIPVEEATVGDWLSSTAFPWDEADAAAHAVVEYDLRPFVPGATGQMAEHWMKQVSGAPPRQEGRARVVCRQAAESWAHHWHRDLLARTENEIREALTRFGLPYAHAVVQRLSNHLRDVLVPQAELLAVHRRADVTAVAPAIRPALAKTRGVISNGQQLIDQLLHGYQDQARTEIYAQAADILRALVLAMADDVLRPMTDELTTAQRVLETALNADDDPPDQLATDHPAAWPTDAERGVPARFDHTENEVLLTNSAYFPAQFDADVRDAVGGGLDGYAEVVRQIIAGDWRTTGPEPPPLDLLQRTAEWRSRAFPTDPTTGRPTMVSAAEYDTHVRPAELLRRARMFVRRPDESFDRFCRLSIRDLLRGDDVQDFAWHEQEVVAKFTEVLGLARPLISVDETAVQAVHAGMSVQYRYKFSEVPVKGLGTARLLGNAVRGDGMIDRPSGAILDAAIGDDGGVTHIDVFGSYPNYSPLVFDAVLGSIGDQWAEVGDIGRESFWQWRRARPLTAALPMGVDERRAMVAGWLVGQIVGRIRIPGAPFVDPVMIFEGGPARWVEFPHPLLTPPSRFIADEDWLPAVLESVLVAIARSHQPPVMRSLAPYRALRSLYDDSAQGKAGGMSVIAAEGVLAEWLTAGVTVPGGHSLVPGADAATSASARAHLAVAWLTAVRDTVINDYLPPDAGGSPDGRFAVISNRAEAAQTPLYRDVAADVHWAAGTLIELLTRIAPLRSPAAEDTPRRGVFISYRRSDEPGLAGRLYDRLSLTFGEDRVFMDVDSIELGWDFVEEVERRIAQCKAMLVVIGRDWAQATAEDGHRRLDDPDDFVRLEIEAGLQDHTVRVIPILVDGARMPRSSELPSTIGALARRNGREMRNARFRLDCTDLILALERIVGS